MLLSSGGCTYGLLESVFAIELLGLIMIDGANLIADINSTGGVKRAYVYAGLDYPLAMTVYTGATAKTYFYLTDKQGTVHAVADEAGNVVEKYRFDAWGRILIVYDGQGRILTQIEQRR